MTTVSPITVDRNDAGRIIRIITQRPSNFHAHFRRGSMMKAVASHIMRGQKYVLVMPNTGPILTVQKAETYWHKLDTIAMNSGFNLLQLIMTMYFSPSLTSDIVSKIARSNVVRAIKYYPPAQGATTGSGHGIPWQEAHEVLTAMQAEGVPWLGHCESTHDKNGRELPHVEREDYFVDNELYRLRDKYPELRICCEHATTRKMVEFVKQDSSGKTACTITPQAMLFALVDGFFPDYSWKNHLKCMPIVKPPEDRDAVLKFATSGDRRAIAGDDTAPHLLEAKSRPFDDCASGCWTPHSTALYALAFERERMLNHRFVQFTALNGPTWWGLPLPHITETVMLVHETEKDIPDPVEVPELNDSVIPLGWSKEPDRYHIGLAMF